MATPSAPRRKRAPPRGPLASAGGRAVAALALAGAARGTVAAETFRTTGSVGSPGIYPETEAFRVEWFNKLWGKWPPARTYPGGRPREETESEGWQRLMEDYEVDARNLVGEPGPWGWERWLELAQMRMTRNYSARGWSHERLDPDVHAGVLQHWQQALERGDIKKESAVGFYITGDRDFASVGNLDSELHSRLVNDVRSKIAAWAKVEDPSSLTLTSIYGLRSYLNGSVLKPHVDVFTTHVLSAVYCVEVRQDEGVEPWYVGADVDFAGEPAKVDLRGGELFLYESAKLPHGRPTTFIGERYTAIFMHFRPPGWDLENYDRVYALPPDYRNPPSKRERKTAEL